MRRLEYHTAVVAALVGLCGCEPTQPPLILESVLPEQYAADRPTLMQLIGSFYSPVSADLASGNQHLRDEFEVEVGGIPLADVQWMSHSDLTAVVPADFPEGFHDVLVRDSLDREATLAQAVEVFPADDGRPHVEFLAPENGAHVGVGERVAVSFYATDGPPGRLLSVSWTVRGLVSQDEPSIIIEPPSREYTGLIEIEVPDVMEGREREIAVIVMVVDDAPLSNEGSARLDLIVDLCHEDDQCDDGDYCNGAERCLDGACESDGPIDCSDGFSCTVDVCDERRRGCLHVPDDGHCDDGRACNGEEVCDLDVGCVSGPAPCDDGIDCTVDYCNEEAEVVCDHFPWDEECSDGAFCNGMETCVIDFGCMPGSDPCEDSFECTRHSCIEATDDCVTRVDHTLCDDGIACTLDQCTKDEGCITIVGVEGPIGDATCSDGFDNDCDGFRDVEDSDCLP